MQILKYFFSPIAILIRHYPIAPSLNVARLGNRDRLNNRLIRLRAIIHVENVLTQLTFLSMFNTERIS